MFFTILIVFICLIFLLVLHEFGHFILAKFFNVKVEEFGIGYPPRIFGKKIGETVYSLNFLPFGAFVKLLGEMARPSAARSSTATPASCLGAAIPAESLGTEKIANNRSFSIQPVWKRVLIAFGGAFSFWIIATIILSVVMTLGTPTAISDEETGTLINPKVQIIAIAPDSPAAKAGLEVGDSITKFLISGSQFQIDKVKKVQELTDQYKGKEIKLTIERGKEIFDVSLTPRLSPPAGEGAMGIALARTAIKSYPWYQSIWRGVKAAIDLTILIVQSLISAISNLIHGLPTGAQLVGPIGIGNLLYQAAKLGFNYFLNLLALISIYLAIFNILPIPAADGGKILFLGIEAIRKKPVSAKIEQNITAVSFSLLLVLMVFVTIKDIIKLF